MREFFNGWRRKVGCVLLVMALAVTGAWIRSVVVADTFLFAIGNQQYMAFSCDGTVEWFSWPVAPSVGPQFITRSVSLFDAKFGWETLGLHGARLHHHDSTIEYWMLSPPLTLLSAYLILWKPRPKERRDA